MQLQYQYSGFQKIKYELKISCFDVDFVCVGAEWQCAAVNAPFLGRESTD